MAVSPRAVASSNTAAAATFLAVEKPTGVLTNDVMIAHIAINGGGPITTPTGWTHINGDTGAFLTSRAYYRVVDGSEGSSFTWPWTGSVEGAGGIVALAGATVTGLLSGIDNQTSNGQNTVISTPSVANALAGAWVLRFGAAGSHETFVAPTSHTLRWTKRGTGNFTIGVGAVDLNAPQASGGATGVVSFTGLSGNAGARMGHTIVILEASGSTPITGSETLVLSEASMVFISRSLTDAITASESAAALTITVPKVGSDSFSLADTRTTQATLARVDELATAESLVLPLSLTRSDSFTLTEAVAQAVARDRTDSFSMADLSALTAAVIGADSVALSDAAVPSAVLAASESFTVTELAESVQTLSLSRTDSVTLSETVSAAQSLVRGDSGSLTEAAALSSGLVVVDLAALSESLVASAAVAGLDDLTTSELAILASVDAKMVNDAFLLSETALTGSETLMSLSDTLALGEAIAYSTALAQADSAVEAALVELESSVSPTEAAVLTDTAAMLHTLYLSGADFTSLAEATALASVLSGGDAAVLDDVSEAGGSVMKAAFDALLLLAETSSTAITVLEGSPEIKFPTGVLLTTWAALVALGARQSGVDLASNIHEAALAAHRAALNVNRREADATVQGKLSSVVLLANQ